MKKTLNKKGAMELSIGTIVIIVLAMSMLIFGIILIKNIMCTGLIMTDQISTGIKNEIKGLFGQQEFGVKCMGEGSQEIRIGDGGRRKIICVIRSDESKIYNLKVDSIESLKGTSNPEVQRWILDKDWNGQVSPGDTEATVLVLDIPRKISTTTLKIVMTVDDGMTQETHTSFVDVVHTGALSSAIC